MRIGSGLMCHTSPQPHTQRATHKLEPRASEFYFMRDSIHPIRSWIRCGGKPIRRK